ncbi:HAD hydrolase-like protein [Teichococcus aestuarii]|uniref:HAD hydrolase-like protein n=1 Tax=Teichococcus aestuarii TaxID=568898 RepID=UPI00361197B6
MAEARWRLAVFDFDGTLADSFPWFRAALPETAARFGFHSPAASELETLRGCDSREILRRLAVPARRLPAIVAHLRARKRAAAGEIPLFPGVPEMLAALRLAGLPVAIASSDSEASIRMTLGPEAGRIGAYACGASLFGKPPRLRGLLRQAGLAPAQALYIGDELRDAEAARAVGMGFAAVSWGYARPEALAATAPLALFRSVAEIAPFCAGSAASSAES